MLKIDCGDHKKQQASPPLPCFPVRGVTSQMLVTTPAVKKSEILFTLFNQINATIMIYCCFSGKVGAELSDSMNIPLSLIKHIFAKT